MDKRESESLKVFDVDKFPVWKYHMETCFEEKDIMLVANGTIPKHGDGAPKVDKVAWNKANILAKRMISSPVSLPVLTNLVNCSTAAYMWSTLCSFYQHKSSEANISGRGYRPPARI
jgi:hypothetical protein